MAAVTFNTPGTGSITVGGGGGSDPPSGVTSIQIECWGAGSGPPSETAAQDSGGASGAYARKNALAVVNGDVLHYQIFAGKAPGDTTSSDLANVILNGGPAYSCAAEGASNPFSLSTAGLAGNSNGDVKFSGAAGTAAQSGGGSRGGSGGSSSAGPAGAGVAGSVGVSSAGGAGAASGTDVGGGGNGGAGGAPGVNGDTPGGGGGGSGSGGGASGTGGSGQVRFTWTAATDTLLGQACL